MWHDAMGALQRLRVATSLSKVTLMSAHRLSLALGSPTEVATRMSLIALHLVVGGTLVLQVLTPTWRSLNGLVRASVSFHLDAKANLPEISNDGVRVAFRKTTFDVPPPKPGAPHAIGAALRNSTSSFARNVALSLGATVFIDQMSAGDQRNGFDGTRRYYWPGDAKIAARDDARPKRCIDLLVDSDYYDDDLLKRLARSFSPTFIYTFVPETAGASGPGFSFSFLPDGTVEYVNDSRTFNHRLHDWSGDVLTIVDGPPWDRVFAVFSVDRRRVADCRMLIALIPLRRWVGPVSYLASATFDHSPLRWLDPRIGRWAVINNRSQDSDTVSIAALGQRSSATVPRAVWDAVSIEYARCFGKKLAFQKALVASQLPPGADFGVKRDHVAAVLAAFFEDTGVKPGLSPALVQVTELVPGILVHQPMAGFDPSAKSGLKQFANPLAMASFAPAQVLGNEERSVKGRIKDIANDQTSVSPYLSRIMDEFSALIIPADLVGTGTPVEPGVVAERQNRPAQIRIQQDADVSGPYYDQAIKCFMKNEAQQKPGDPRNISTLPGQVKIGYSACMYAFSDNVLCKCPFVACAISPMEIAGRVASLATLGEDKDMVLCADMSRMDGHESYPMRRMMEGIFYKFFHPCYHTELARLMAAQHSQQGRTRFGHRFTTGASRLSGSPETSAWNTIEMAFMLYLTLRMTKVDGADMGPMEAWSRLCKDCLVLGDDSIFGTHSCHDTEALFLRATTMCLHKATVDACVPGGDIPVTFLSRVYSPWVFYGFTSSMCCIKRAVQKWHTCAILEPGAQGPLKKLVEKSLSILCSDADTPVLGALSLRALELASAVPGMVPTTGNRYAAVDSPERGALYSGDTSWWARQWGPNPLVAYPNTDYDGWMLAELERDLPGFDLDKFTECIANAQTWNDLLRLPLFWAGERDVIPDSLKQQMVVGDYIVEEAPDKKAKPSDTAMEAAVVPPKSLAAVSRPFLAEREDGGTTSESSSGNKSRGTSTRRRRGRRTPRSSLSREPESATEATSGGDSMTAPSGP